MSRIISTMCKQDDEIACLEEELEAALREILTLQTKVHITFKRNYKNMTDNTLNKITIGLQILVVLGMLVNIGITLWVFTSG